MKELLRCLKCNHEFELSQNEVKQFRDKYQYCNCPSCGIALNIKCKNIITLGDLLSDNETNETPFKTVYKITGIIK